MAIDYYLCDQCGDKCFYDAEIAEYDEEGRYLLSGRAVDIAALCETCVKTHACIVVTRDEATEASMHLRRAAPELLEVLRSIVAHFNDLLQTEAPDVRQKALDAIAKAQGRS